MDVVDLDLCVVLPVNVLDAWVRADPQTRADWLSIDGQVGELAVNNEVAFVFRRERPRPNKALVVTEPRKRVNIVVAGREAAVKQAIDDPDMAYLLSGYLKVPGAMIVMGGDLAHADVAGGTPVAGPHRMVDLEPGPYRVELRSVGDPGDPEFAMVIAYEPVPAAS
jgi:hypothetical protein